MLTIEYAGLISKSGELWHICGKEVVLLHITNMPFEKVTEMIQGYFKVLSECRYITDSTLLPSCFEFFGGVGFIRLGLAFGYCFKACFAYYADVFALEWKNGNKNLHAKNIGYAYVFELMYADVVKRIEEDCNE